MMNSAFVLLLLQFRDIISVTLFRSLVTFIASRRSRLGRVVPDEHVSGREQKSSTVFYGEV